MSKIIPTGPDEFDWQRCKCPGAVYCDDAKVAFDPDVYDCERCGHMNGFHCGPNGECWCKAEVTTVAPFLEDGPLPHFD